jgi:hypothetical protein
MTAKSSEQAGQRASTTSPLRMNGRIAERKRPPVIGLCAFFLTTLGAHGASAEPWGQALHARGILEPMVIDYELPGHPREVGRGHTGTIGRLSLVWTYDEHITIEAGALGRLAFAHNFAEEADAFPILAVTLRPFGPWLALRLGSLDIRHGFHHAILDEDLYAYGRPYQEAYNRTLVPSSARDLGGDPFLPVESGASIKADLWDIKAELYLDWQLLETEAHREKFAVGVLGAYEGRFLDAGFQYRLVHYGGQLYTQLRPGVDPKRQPTTLAAYVTPKVTLEWLRLEAPITFVQGRAVQTRGGIEEGHRGLEVGADAWLFDTVRFGYRAWLPERGEAGSVSEDADPIYNGPRSHRAILGMVNELGPATLSGRLDLVFAEGSSKLQYLTVTTVTFKFEPAIFVDPSP